ncbi:MAG: hypothetical protein QOF69_2132 [Solirubrobacteraceae bacterium]|jgi:hypothetical protein|nr:hypothetical protein [Solirubrobacteraceae bacterium]MEA2182947.1 hypothetical protein [Solirubrobacteraceae bacterium]
MLATRARENLLTTRAARAAAHEDIRTERLDAQERGRRRRRWWSGILAGDPAPFALKGVGKAVTRGDPVARGAAVVTARARSSGSAGWVKTSALRKYMGPLPAAREMIS